MKRKTFILAVVFVLICMGTACKNTDAAREVVITPDMVDLYHNIPEYIDGKTVEVNGNGEAQVGDLQKPDFSLEPAQIGPDPASQSEPKLLLLDSVAWGMDYEKKDWRAITPEMQKNPEQMKNIWYMATFNFYDAGFTDENMPYYAVELELVAMSEKAPSIQSYSLNIRPGGNQHDLLYGFSANKENSREIRDIRYYHYTGDAPEQPTVTLTAFFEVPNYNPFVSGTQYTVNTTELRG